MERKFFPTLCAVAIAICLHLQLGLAQSTSASPLPAPSANEVPAAKGHCRDIAEGDSRLEPLGDVCEFAESFLHRLPDFICDQTTTTTGRMSTTVVKEKVQFVGGHESYSDVMVNGHLEEPGYDSYITLNARKLISAGELGSDLVDLFAPLIGADFQYRKDTKAGPSQAKVFSFHLPAEKNMFWMLRDSRGVSIHPEYEGEIWVDHASGRVLRLSLQPRHLPYNFGFQSAEITIDYQEVPITGAGVFLLPSRSETKACMRYDELRDPVCTKSNLTFHDCRKFAAKSRLLTDNPVSPPP